MKFPEIDRNVTQCQLALLGHSQIESQILTYSAYYPNHRKRIHLFGENLDKLPNIESACLPFNVIVTGEEVKNG